MREKWPDPWYMPGTERTGEYVVVVLTELGRLGYRSLDRGTRFRIRVEPKDLGRAPLAKLLTSSHGWKQPEPDGQDRFSLELGEERLTAELDFAIRALDPGKPGTVVNPSAPERDQLIVEVAQGVRETSAKRRVPRRVFFSYSHKDKIWLERFHTMLKPAMRSEMLWDDTKIDPGQKWKEEIRKSLISARVAVLLVSQHFLASDFIRNNELTPILDAEKAEGLLLHVARYRHLCVSSFA